MTRPDPEFVDRARSLESAYLDFDDPVAQSGFSGGRTRWISERSPVVEAIHRPGSFLDVGCANGLLALDVVTWAGERGIELEPHGIDLGERLIELARERHPDIPTNFHVADAWSWEPSRQWTYVYSLLDLSPETIWCDWLARLLSWVEPGGRLIIGSYGSKSRSLAPEDVAMVMIGCGLSVTGQSAGGSPPVTRFAWAEPRNPQTLGGGT